MPAIGLRDYLWHAELDFLKTFIYSIGYRQPFISKIRGNWYVFQKNKKMKAYPMYQLMMSFKCLGLIKYINVVNSSMNQINMIEILPTWCLLPNCWFYIIFFTWNMHSIIMIWFNIFLINISPLLRVAQFGIYDIILSSNVTHSCS